MEYNPATDPAKKRVTLQEVVDAIRENNFAQNHNFFFDFIDFNGKRKIAAACALGLAAIKLHVDADRLYQELEGCKDEHDGEAHYHIGSRIAFLNDNDRKTFIQIADSIENEFRMELDLEFFVDKQDHETV